MGAINLILVNAKCRNDMVFVYDSDILVVKPYKHVDIPASD